jgi:hypothetical protein
MTKTFGLKLMLKCDHIALLSRVCKIRYKKGYKQVLISIVFRKKMPGEV